MAFTDDYFLRATDEEVVMAFMSDCCKVAPGAKIEAGKLYDAYVVWSEKCGYVLSLVAFGRAMRRVGIESKRAGWVRWIDIRLNE